MMKQKVKTVFNLLLAILLPITIMVCFFSSCSNENWGLGNYNFTKAHISVGGEETCVKVKSWHDNELGCELELEDGNVIYCSEGTYILLENYCPICDK